MSVGQYNGAARPNYVPARPVADYVPRMGAAEMHAREREAAAPPREPSISAARSGAPVALCLRCYRLPDLCACDAPETTQPAVPALEDDMLPSTDGRAGVTGAAAMKWLETHDAITAADLHEACGDQVTRRGAKSALQRMMSQGVLRRVSNGRYALATNATASGEGSAPTEAADSAEQSSAAGKGKPATEGGADEGGMAEAIARSDWVKLPADVGDEADAGADLSLHGAAGVSRPMPDAMQPMDGKWPDSNLDADGDVTVYATRPRPVCARTGRPLDECPREVVSTMPATNAPELEHVTSRCTDCGTHSYATRERHPGVAEAVAVHGAQWRTAAARERDPLATDTQWREPITMADIAARHTEAPSADEARAALVRLRHFIDSAEARPALPPIHPVSDLDEKRELVEMLRGVLAIHNGVLLRDLLADAERLQEIAVSTWNVAEGRG